MKINEGFGVDISNWSGEITREQVECWKRNHVKRVIIGTQREAITRQQMQTVVDAGGLELQAYVYLYDYGYYAFDAQVREAHRRIQGFPVTKLYLDCEFATTAPPDVVVERIWLAVNTAAQFATPFAIYTGRWWWEPMTDNSAEFADYGVGLWHSHYFDFGPNHRSNLRPIPAGYGGWVFCNMWQYRGSTIFCDVNVDYNYFYEETEVDEDRIAELERQLAELTEEHELLSVKMYIYAVILNAVLKEKWATVRDAAGFMLKREKRF